jgi:hypothetical protein
MHPSEWWMLQQIEEHLRRKDPDLDAFLAGRSALRRPLLAVWPMYLALPVFVILGVTLDVTVLVVAGVVATPFIPVTAWLLIRGRAR